MLSKQQIKEIQEFLKDIEDTKPNIQNMVQVSINEFNNSSVKNLKG